MIEIRASCSPGEIRIAVTEQDQLLDAALWRPGNPDGWDDLHLVRIRASAPSLGGFFVALEGGEEGFLPSKQSLSEGALVAARVIRCAQNGKGLRLKQADAPKDLSATAPVRLERGLSPLAELAERYPGAPLLTDDPAIATALSAPLRKNLALVRTAFDPVLEADFEALSAEEVSLGPIHAHIAPTQALVAIDLDAAEKPDFSTNIACFPALARQIRLRNLSGTILIDPAGVRTRKRAALVPFLRDAFRDDPLSPALFGATPSGLLEMTRPRRRPPLHELTASAHGVGLALLRQILRENRPGDVLHGSIALIRALERDRKALDEFSSRRGRDLSLSLIPDAPLSYWRLS